MNLSFEQENSIGFRCVLDMLDPYSPYGEQLRRELRPKSPSQRDQLELELSNLEKLKTAMPDNRELFAAVSRSLMAFKDVRRSVSRVMTLSCGVVEMFELKRFLLNLQKLSIAYSKLNGLVGLSGIEIRPIPAALAILDPEGTGTPTFHVSERLSRELYDIRTEKRELELILRELTGEERAAAMEQRNLVAAREEREEERLLMELCGKLKPYVQEMTDNIRAVAVLDLTLAKARLALCYPAVRPSFTSGELKLCGMTNPKISDALKESGAAFTPIDISLDKGTAVITGANMGGKSVAILTLALNVYLAHCGMFCFAKSAKIPLFDAVYLIAEEAQDSRNGLSSFGAEVVRLNSALSGCPKDGLSLLLFDEPARGTNPSEGARIVEGVLRYLQDKPVVALFATHFDGAARYAGRHYRVKGLSGLDRDALKDALSASGAVGVDAIRRVMDYGLIPVGAGDPVPKDALTICALLGMDKELLSEIQRNYDTEK
ncbi:MAG TPA: hypothetical protein P5116_03850 [Eubacteriales bacterium]|nr:hypothetical protein [Clostridia bacterium]HRV72995.1 hypothetical protein [Eubacteriales bacterium]